MVHRPDTLEHAPLGRDSAYPEQYDAGLLYPIPRAANRAPLGIEEGALPFVGEDEWHAFEVSWLNGRGKPRGSCHRLRALRHRSDLRRRLGARPAAHPELLVVVVVGHALAPLHAPPHSPSALVAE